MIFWYVSVGILSTLLSLSLFYCLRFGIIILRVQDTLQKAVDTIDEKHESITEILARPLFFDSPEVRQVLKDIGDVRNSLNDMAKDLTKDFKEKEES